MPDRCKALKQRRPRRHDARPEYELVLMATTLPPLHRHKRLNGQEIDIERSVEGLN